MPKVSIIVPAYNAEKTLKTAVRSLQKQTLREVEILIIDDGSKDGTGKLADKLAAADSRIKVIHQPNAGVSAARNTGLAAASGEFIGFCDADDWCAFGMYEALYTAAKAYDAADCLCGMYFDTYKSIPLPLWFLGEDAVKAGKELRDRLLLLFAACQDGPVWKHIFRRDILQGLRFSEELRYAEDVAFLQEALRRTKISVALKDCFYHYLSRPNSVCHTMGMDAFTSLVFVGSKGLHILHEEGLDTPENLRYVAAAFGRQFLGAEIATTIRQARMTEEDVAAYFGKLLEEPSLRLLRDIDIPNGGESLHVLQEALRTGDFMPYCSLMAAQPLPKHGSFYNFLRRLSYQRWLLWQKLTIG
ncbi:MAG: glycosyltransferase [Oscillospiraceae bacterium]|jgi:glycosyltransferase involved in cell wall biosynthesis|nr:glycosyltransferase [Oscillospiraceae bacterium]